MGGLAVFGFLTAYGVVDSATMRHRRREGTLRIGTGLLAISAMFAMLRRADRRRTTAAARAIPLFSACLRGVHGWLDSAGTTPSRRKGLR